MDKNCKGLSSETIPIRIEWGKKKEKNWNIQIRLRKKKRNLEFYIQWNYNSN